MPASTRWIEFEDLTEMSVYQQFRERAIAGDLLARERLHLMIRGAIQGARGLAKKDLLDDPGRGCCSSAATGSVCGSAKEKAQMIMGQ